MTTEKSAATDQTEQAREVYYLTPHQARFLTAGTPMVAIFGGVGSGKSFAAALLLIQHLIEFPGTVALYVRHTQEDLALTSLVDFEERFGRYIERIDRARLIVTLINGSKIIFRHGWDAVRKVKHLDAYNISAFVMSQAEECPQQTYDKLIHRLRRTKTAFGKPITKHLQILEGNPAGRDWIFRLFCSGAKVEECVEDVGGKSKPYRVWTRPGRTLIQCQTADYPFVRDGYEAQTRADASERWVRRYVDGEFDQFTGSVYSEFNEQIHVIAPLKTKPVLPKTWRRLIGIDWGLRNPCAILWAVWDTVDDIIFVYREGYRTGYTAHEQGEYLVKMTGDEKVDGIAIDPSTFARSPVSAVTIASEFNRAFEDVGRSWTVDPADNKVEAGIEAVCQQLRNTDAGPGLFISRDCPNLIKEIREYRYDDNEDNVKKNAREQPIKLSDHACDALRYLIMAKEGYRVSPGDLKVSKRGGRRDSEYLGLDR